MAYFCEPQVFFDRTGRRVHARARSSRARRASAASLLLAALAAWELRVVTCELRSATPQLHHGAQQQ